MLTTFEPRRQWANRLIAGLLVATTLAGGLACDRFEVGERGTASQAALAREAKITADQAGLAALAAFPGSVQQVRLARDGGNVVYEVMILPEAGGAATDVEVDASTGQVLKTQPARTLSHDEYDDDD